MSTWRYVARLVIVGSSMSGRATFSDGTIPYDYDLKSEKQGLDELDSFLASRRRWFNERLKWVALEQSTTNSACRDPAGTWAEVKRILA